MVLSLLVRVSEAKSEGVNMTRLLLVYRPSLDGLEINYEEIRRLFASSRALIIDNLS